MLYAVGILGEQEPSAKRSGECESGALTGRDRDDGPGPVFSQKGKCKTPSETRREMVCAEGKTLSEPPVIVDVEGEARSGEVKVAGWSERSGAVIKS